MYKPIVSVDLLHTTEESIIDQLTKKIGEDFDNAVYAKVNAVINVDKDELIKALAYDRNQYQQGYSDGQKEATEWHPFVFSEVTEEDLEFDPDVLQRVTNCPEDEQPILVCNSRGDIWIDRFYSTPFDGCGLDKHDELKPGMAWMPLPEPYKGE